MLLKHIHSGDLVEVIDLFELMNPDHNHNQIACIPWSSRVLDPLCYEKSELCFASGESLPKCWFETQFDENLLSTELLHS